MTDDDSVSQDLCTPRTTSAVSEPYKRSTKRCHLCRAMKVGIQGTSAKSGMGIAAHEFEAMRLVEDSKPAGVLLLREGAIA